MARALGHPRSSRRPHARAPLRPRGRPPIPGLHDAIRARAEDIFARRDYHEVQMDDVAAACGIGKGTLYRHFRSKRELYLAITFDGISRLRAELEATLEVPDLPARQLERIVRGTLAFFWDRRFFFALIHRHEHRFDADAREWMRQRAQLSSLIAATLARAMAAGHVRRIDCRIGTEILLGMARREPLSHPRRSPRTPGHDGRRRLHARRRHTVGPPRPRARYARRERARPPRVLTDRPMMPPASGWRAGVRGATTARGGRHPAAAR